jgi:hypothetical protein
MAHYFKPFPAIEYSIPGITSIMAVTDITRRFTLNTILKNNAAIYFDYEIKDGDRPDIIADKYYGDETLDWVILLTNEIHDPYFLWPLSYENFSSYIRKKYGSVSAAQSVTHHYEKTIQDITYNTDGTVVPKRTVVVDYITYSQDVSNSRIVDNYTYESELNETRRNIKILDERFIGLVIDSHRRIFK